MKYLLLFLFIVSSYNAKAQLLGQTKTFILNQFQDWHVEDNSTPYFLFIDNKYFRYLFYFDSSNNFLCRMYYIEFERGHGGEEQILNTVNAIYYGSFTRTEFVSICKGRRGIYLPAKVYQALNMTITVYDCDLCGYTGEKECLMIETKTE